MPAAAAALSPYALSFKKVSMNLPLTGTSKEPSLAPCRKPFQMVISFPVLINTTELPMGVHIFATREN